MYVLIGLILMAVIGVLSYKLKFVDITGLISGLAIGVTIWTFGGIGPFVMILGFFTASGLATKYKYRKKKKDGVAQESSGQRGWKNIVGSGLVPAILAVFLYLAHLADWNTLIFYIAYASSVATVTADTLASEIGVLSKSRPRLITSLTRRVPRGTPGGVSGLGLKVELLTSLIFGFVTALFALFPESISWNSTPFIEVSGALSLLPVIMLCGFVGSNLDSLAGAIATKWRKRIDGTLVNFGSSVMGGILGVLVAVGFIWFIFGILLAWVVIGGSN